MRDLDFGRAADDYVRHRAGYPASLFESLVACGLGRAGQRVVDLGTGTGRLAAGLAWRGAHVVGVDVSPGMLAAAERECSVVTTPDAERGTLRFVLAPAEATTLPSHAFDALTAAQCWHWFTRDAAAREARRLLVPGGRIALAHFDWLPLPGNVVEATEALVLAHNPAWTMAGGTGVYPRWFADLAGAGFVGLESRTWDVAVPYDHASWRGRIRASAGVGGTLAPEAVARFDAELAALLARDFPREPLDVPHRVFVLTGRAPGAEADAPPGGGVCDDAGPRPEDVP
ncbi:MAG: methyltransferase domain-containing protein [Planctomycetes bacterium]|nr:methyltransferase domain-containing protein [Planctomycetota bacterium]